MPCSGRDEDNASAPWPIAPIRHVFRELVSVGVRAQGGKQLASHLQPGVFKFSTFALPAFVRKCPHGIAIQVRSTKCARGAAPVNRRPLRDDKAASDLPIWQEALFGMEVLLLHAAPVYYGFGVPRGDNSAVVIIPGFLLTDLYLAEMYGWLARVGYQPYFSGIGINADCPNLLIRRQLIETIERARRQIGRKIHLIGHSLGGVLARSVAGDLPEDIASVITLGSPFRGTVAH